MAKRYTHPAPDERYYIKARPEAGDSRAEIARSLGRSASTVSREMKRNTGLRGYRPKQAQRLCDGREFADHAAVSRATGSDAYFARPYRSRERGLNEHGGGLLRQYFPKSMPLDGITDEQVGRAVSRINHRPRKCLGFKTPVEVLQNAYDSGEITVSPSVALQGRI